MVVFLNPQNMSEQLNCFRLKVHQNNGAKETIKTNGKFSVKL